MSPLLSSYLRNRRTKKVRPYLRGDILDIGCGPAPVMQFISTAQRYVGIEIDRKLIEELTKKFPKCDFYCCNVDNHDLPLKSTKFDTILLIAVIEHLLAPAKVLEQCYELLGKEGNLIITTPSPLGDIIHKVGAKIGLTSKEAVESHYKIYTKQELISLLNQNSFCLVAYRRFILGLNQMFLCRAKK